MSKLTHVKWIGPNEPLIKILRNDARLYLTKRELLDLAKEITEFIEYYPSDFSKDRLDQITDMTTTDIDWTYE